MHGIATGKVAWVAILILKVVRCITIASYVRIPPWVKLDDSSYDLAKYYIASFPDPSFSFKSDGEKTGPGTHCLRMCTNYQGNLDISAVFYSVTLWMMAAASHRQLQTSQQKLPPVHLY